MSYKGLDSITSSDIAAIGGVSTEVAQGIYEKLTQIIRNYGSATPEAWLSISTSVLSPELPFSVHQMMYYGCFKDFGPDPPVWIPDPYDPLPLSLSFNFIIPLASSIDINH